MISILIPTYNYDVFPLVENLYNQCKKADILFEIVVFDDASQNHFNNPRINELENSSFKVLDKNIGRSAIRNLLAKTAKYEWLLFLDADVIPMHDQLINNYLKEIHSGEKIIYGGIRYQEERPSDNQLLRWVYGNKREAITASERAKEEHLSFLTLNFLIHKTVFDAVKFNEEIPNLRNEDLLFSYDLQQAKVAIKHIDNPVYHLGIETSEIFIRKTEEGVISFLFLWNNNLLPYHYTPFGKAFTLINKLKIRKIIAFFFSMIKSAMLKNLNSTKPSMFVYDLYRLGYLCSLKSR